MSATFHHPLQRVRGFSLVEIMVALAMGMIGMLIVLQLFKMSEASKRTTTGANDAQTAGAITLATLQHDIQQGGYGVSAFNLLGCNVQLRPGVTLNGLAPITINHASIPAGDANTDTLMIVYGNPNGAPEGDAITAQPGPGTTTYQMATPPSFNDDDYVIAEPNIRPSPCNLVLDQIAVHAVPPSLNVTVKTGTGASNLSNGILYNLGQRVNPGQSGLSPAVLVYAVRNGTLTVCDYLANDCSNIADTGNRAVWVPVTGNVVSLRAQYGRDTSVPADGFVDIFDQSTPSSASTTLACDWSRISSLRLALVMRSSQFDQSAPTSQAPVWEGSVADNPVGSAATPIDLSTNAGLASGTTWQQYRYKVYQTLIPVRAVVWMGAQAGC